MSENWPQMQIDLSQANVNLRTIVGCLRTLSTNSNGQQMQICRSIHHKRARLESVAPDQKGVQLTGAGDEQPVKSH